MRGVHAISKMDGTFSLILTRAWRLLSDTDHEKSAFPARDGSVHLGGIFMCRRHPRCARARRAGRLLAPPGFNARRLARASGKFFCAKNPAAKSRSRRGANQPSRSEERRVGK